MNNLLAAAPGMDWTTLSGLYGNVDGVHHAAARAGDVLPSRSPTTPRRHFVLAYHYLVAGHDDAAAAQLKLVVARQPEDQVAKRMLAALSPAEPTSQPPATAQPAAAPAAAPPAQTGPTTDLVGVWRAERNGDAFELSIDENSQFTWKATPKGKPPVTLTGTMTTAGNAMLAGRARTRARWPPRSSRAGRTSSSSSPPAVPPDDTGLSFQRVKQNP